MCILYNCIIQNNAFETGIYETQFEMQIGVNPSCFIYFSI